MASRDPACERLAEAFERLIDGDLLEGDPDIVESRAGGKAASRMAGKAEIDAEIDRLKDHLASCEACRALYGLDLALIESIRTAPRMAFESVASEVVKEVRARERRSLVVRWGPVVGVASWVAMIGVVYGRSMLERLLGLLTGGLQSSPALGGLGRVAGVGIKLLEIAKSIAFDGALGSGVSAYAPQVAMGILMAGALVIFMMYGMGVWLRKPREVRSWRRSS